MSVVSFFGIIHSTSGWEFTLCPLLYPILVSIVSSLRALHRCTFSFVLATFSTSPRRVSMGCIPRPFREGWVCYLNRVFRRFRVREIDSFRLPSST